MWRLFGLLVLAGLLMPVMGCSVEHEDDDDGAELKVKVDD